MVVTQDRSDLARRLEAARAVAERNVLAMEVLRSRLTATLRRAGDRGHQAVPTNDKALIEHLQARLDSLPVIEQAKGIIMAQTGGNPDHAFDVLRRASQRSNIKVRDLAADIVRRAERHRDAGPSTNHVDTARTG